MSLADRTIPTVREGTPALAGEELDALIAELGGDWDATGGKLRKTYRFPDFARALRFVDGVGAMADEMDHHPDVELSWGKATIQIWTHTVGGLSELDFVFAARCDAIFAGEPAPATRPG